MRNAIPEPSTEETSTSLSKSEESRGGPSLCRWPPGRCNNWLGRQFLCPGLFAAIGRRPSVRVHIETDPAIFLAGGPNWDSFSFVIPRDLAEVGTPPRRARSRRSTCGRQLSTIRVNGLRIYGSSSMASVMPYRSTITGTHFTLRQRLALNPFPGIRMSGGHPGPRTSLRVSLERIRSDSRGGSLVLPPL